jgi:hypothetical protein
MSNGSFYQKWNFLDNPFSALPLGADRAGDELLVGREAQLKAVLFRLNAGGSAVCLDGPVGVGKTSLANVAAYRAQIACHADARESPLLIPCRSTFQISKDETPEHFRLRILVEVAQTLIEKASYFRTSPSINETETRASWLDSPRIPILASQISALGTDTQTSPAFATAALIKQVTEWLMAIFPEGQRGGVICIIDNLELLETSAVARKTIESLRDTLFIIKGIRWILCGAHGIIHSVVASQRLVGHLGAPLEVPPLQLTQAQEVFNARTTYFKDQTRGPMYLPLTADDFHNLFMIVNKNLRQTLAYSDEYCLSVAEVGSPPSGAPEKAQRFNAWLKKRAEVIKESIHNQVGPRAMQLLRDAIRDKQGDFSPSDYASLGFNTLPTMRPHVKALEEVGLLEAEKDDVDQRRKSISVTGKGWLINWLQVTA